MYRDHPSAQRGAHTEQAPALDSSFMGVITSHGCVSMGRVPGLCLARGELLTQGEGHSAVGSEECGRRGGRMGGSSHTGPRGSIAT